MMKKHMERSHNNSTVDSRIATFYFTTNPITQPPTLNDPIWYQEVNNARNTLQIARVKETQDLPQGKDKSVSTSVKKGYYVKTHLVVATKETAFGSKSWTSIMGVTPGKGDYGKEDQVRTELNNKEGILGKQNVDPDHVLSYFSYQKALENMSQDRLDALSAFIKENPAFPDIEQYRRVSKYNLPNPEELELTSRGQADADLEKYLLAIKKFEVDRIVSDYAILMKNLWSIFHQIIKIHELLYLAKITHGDMHMGNIKVIVVNGEVGNQGVVVKAFDFGKAKYRSETENYTRQDLEYLLQRNSVGGAFYGTLEDGKRHVWRSTHNPLRMNLKSWGKERDKTEAELKMENEGRSGAPYIAGPLDSDGQPTWIRNTKVTTGAESKFGKESKSMFKHFPLHHLLETMAWVHANTTKPPKPQLITNVLQAQALIDRTATPFLNYLSLIRKSTFKVFDKSPPETGDEVSSIKNAFSTFANTMTDDINLLLSENPDQALLRRFREFGIDIDDM
jgi:hypothetical protein